MRKTAFGLSSLNKRAVSRFTFRVCAWGLACAVIGFLLAFFKIISYDAWFHLAAGRHVWEGGLVPTADPFSFVETNPWLYHSWLSGLWMHALHALGGGTGVIVWKAIWVACVGVVLFTSMVRRGARPSASAGLCMLGLLAFRYRMVVRPMVFTTLFGALTWLVLDMHYRRERCLLWLLPPVFALWINLHPGALIGIAMMGVHIVAELIRVLREPRGRPKLMPKPVARLVLTMALSLAAMLCNPYGIKALLTPLHLAEQRYYLDMTLEWQRMPFTIQFFNPLSPLFMYGAMPFWVLIACAAAGWIRFWRRYSWLDTLALWSFGALAIMNRRHADIFVIAILPGLATAIHGAEGWLRERWSTARATWRGADTVIVLVTLAVFGLALPGGTEYDFGVGTRPFGLPTGGAAFLRAIGARGRVFNQWVWGGYLIWQGHPRRQVFIDTRSLTYGEGRFREYDSIQKGSDWEDVLRNYGVECLVLDHSWHRSFYGSALWPVVYWGSECVVALRSRLENEETIRRFGCAESVPSNITAKALVGPTRLTIERQLRAKLEQDPECGIAHYHLGRCLAGDGHYYLAIEEFRRTVHCLPRYSLAYHNWGFCLYRLSVYGSAIKRFKQAIRLNPKLTASYQGIGDCHDRMGRQDKALRWYAKAVRIDPRFWSARRQRVSIYLKRGEMGKARKELQDMVRLGNQEPAVAQKLRELEGG